MDAGGWGGSAVSGIGADEGGICTWLTSHLRLWQRPRHPPAARAVRVAVGINGLHLVGTNKRFARI